MLHHPCFDWMDGRSECVDRETDQQLLEHFSCSRTCDSKFLAVQDLEMLDFVERHRVGLLSCCYQCCDESEAVLADVFGWPVDLAALAVSGAWGAVVLNFDDCSVGC